MNKLFFFMSILFSLSSCNNSSVKKDTLSIDQERKNILENVKKTSDEIKKNAYEKINILNIDYDKSFIEIEYIINEETIKDSTHQIYFLSYLVYKNEKLWNFENISIDYYLGSEKHKTQKYIFTNETKKLLALSFKSSIFNRMLKFCLSEFDIESVYGFEFYQKNVNSRYPDDTLKENFFELLEVFSQECDNKIDSKDAKATIVIMFVAIRYYIDNAPEDQPYLESHKKIKKILEDLWQICENEKIEFAEQRLFGSVGDNW